MSSRSPIRLSTRALAVLLATTGVVIALSSGLIRHSFAETSAPTQKSSQKVALSKSEVAARYGKLPLSFEPNEGQTDPQVKFLSRGQGYSLFLTSSGMVLTLREPKPPSTDKVVGAEPAAGQTSSSEQKLHVLRLTMLGANPKPHVEGQNELPGKINYFVGDDKSKWRTNIPTYLKVHYAEIYPKVDLVYYGNQSELEYDFIVAPGGKVQAIKFQIEGADRVNLDRTGNLILEVNKHELRLSKPVIYQLNDKGDRREIKGDYLVKGREVGFKVESFDSTKPLIIDPVLSYATLVGSGGHEHAYGIAVDQSGNAYITGNTNSSSFPTTAGAFQVANGFLSGVFVTKLDATGSNLIYSTYLAGSGASSSSIGTAIAVDTVGHAYVTGHTASSDFPTQNPIRGGRYNLLKTSDAGAVWSKKSVGSINAPVIALAVDQITPSTIYAGSSFGGGIHKSIDSGTTWNPLVTGVTNATCPALVIDPSSPSTIYAALTTTSFTGGVFKSTDGGTTWVSVNTGLPTASVTALAIDPLSPSTLYAGTQSGMYKTTNGGGSWVQSSTGLNFSGFTSILIDPASPSTIYAGLAGGGVFKTTNSAANWSQVNTGLTNTTVRTLSFDPTSPSTLYAGTVGGGIFKSTNSGGNWSPINNGLASNTQVISSVLDPSSPSTIFIGTSNGQIFKTTNGGNNWTRIFETLTSTRVNTLVMDPAAPATVYAGVDTTAQSLFDSEVFATKLNPDGSGLIYSTFLGGMLDDRGYGIAIDSTGAAFIAGETASNNFPTINAIMGFGGCTDGFVTKLNASGSEYVFSTYLGGSGCDLANAIATDAAGNAYATGSTNSSNFPLANAFQATKGSVSGSDAFATKINANGTLGYSTYLGGNDQDIGYGVAVDSTGNAHITGQTSSSNFPTLNSVQTNPNSFLGNAFVTKLNNIGSGLIYSTYLGGSNAADVGRGIAVDPSGNAYVTGFTSSIDFPVVAGALRTRSPLYRTVDGGAAWNNDNYGLNGDVVTALAVDPTNPSIVFAATHKGVFRSADGGRNWSLSSTGLVTFVIFNIVFDPLTPSTVYLTDFNGSFGVYKSVNGGANWTELNNSVNPNADVLSLAIDPVTPTTLYAGWSGGVFKSVDGGTSWASMSQGLSFSPINEIAIDPSTPTTLYASSNNSNGGVFKSIDGGANWQKFNTGLTSTFIRHLAMDPSNPAILYAGASDRLFKSIDGAVSWIPIGPTWTNSSLSAIAIDSITPTTLYLAISGSSAGILKSVDGGTNWISINNGLRHMSFFAMVVNPLASSNLYLGVNVNPVGNDGFVTKLNPTGSEMIYSTLLGGTSAEAFSIAVDSSGGAYVSGRSNSSDFPVTTDSYQPFSRGFSDVFVAKLIMSYIISGQVLDGSNNPVSGAEITLSDGLTLKSVLTESDGSYQFSPLREGGDFTVSAAKPGFAMSPQSQTFNNLNSNQTLNFVATATNDPFYTISGQVTENSVGLGGVTVTLSGSQSSVRTTDSTGNYSFTLAGGSDYTVTPAKPGFAFTPTSLSFNGLSANQIADFISTRQGFVVTNANNHGTGSLRQLSSMLMRTREWT
ncbi:MAG TPA: SBBP repeat-containing protein [Pyrinomonadaceae bacterium]|nr:SBBP repeat-containing protein [Pyrinomonadaceae bacterium]